MAPRARKGGALPPLVSPPVEYQHDDSVQGTLVTIKGEHGQYRVVTHEKNVKTGAHWFVLFGGAKYHECWRHVHPSNVKVRRPARAQRDS